MPIKFPEQRLQSKAQYLKRLLQFSSFRDKKCGLRQIPFNLYWEIPFWIAKGFTTLDDNPNMKYFSAFINEMFLHMFITILASNHSALYILLSRYVYCYILHFLLIAWLDVSWQNHGHEREMR